MIKQTLCGVIAALSLASCGRSYPFVTENSFNQNDGGEINNISDAGFDYDAGNVLDGGVDAGVFVCEEGEIKKSVCGLNGRGSIGEKCVDNQFISGECADPDKCVDNTINQLNCGLNNRGTLTEVCVNGQPFNGHCQDPDVCIDGDSYNVQCGLNNRGSTTKNCVDGQIISGECIDVDECVDGISRVLSCGLNNRGIKQVYCITGHYNERNCIDQDVCLDGRVNEINCGLNGRGKIREICVDGQIINDHCQDPDICIDGDSYNVQCGLNNRGSLERNCVNGQIVSGECVEIDECVDGISRDLSCGLNGRGNLTETCVSGKYVSGMCSDPDVCVDGNSERIHCGLNNRGSLEKRCANGQIVSGECVDVDECTDGDLVVTPCGFEGEGGEIYKSCENGHYNSSRCIFPNPPECSNNEIRIENCGMNDRGTETYRCNSIGHFVLDSSCVDNDVCLDNLVRTVPCDNTCIGERKEVCVLGQWEKTDCEEIIPILDAAKYSYMNFIFDQGRIAIDGSIYDANSGNFLHEIAVLDPNRNNQLITIDRIASIRNFDFKNNRIIYSLFDPLNPALVNIAEIDNNLNVTRRYNVTLNNFTFTDYYDDDLRLNDYGITYLNSNAQFPNERVFFYDFSNNTNIEINSSFPSPFGPGCFATPVNYGTAQSISNGFFMLGYGLSSCGDISNNPPIFLSPFGNYNWQELPIRGIKPKFKNSTIFYLDRESLNDFNLRAYKPNDFNNPLTNYAVIQINNGSSLLLYGVSGNQIAYFNSNNNLFGNYKVATVDFDNGKICRQSTHSINVRHSNSLYYESLAEVAFSNGQILFNETGRYNRLSICKLKPCTVWEDADITRY